MIYILNRYVKGIADILGLILVPNFSMWKALLYVYMSVVSRNTNV